MSALVGGLSIVLLALLAVALVTAPLWRRGARLPRAQEPGAVDVSARRARLVEMEQEWRRGLLDEESYAEARAEAERELLLALEQADEEGKSGNRQQSLLGRRMVLATALAIPVLATGLYWQTGSPQVLLGGGTMPEPVSRDAAINRIEAGIPALESRLQERPGDIEGWVMLTRSYQMLSRPAEAASAAARGIEANGDIPALLVEQARALAEVQGGFDSEATELLDRALRRAPGHPDALWFRGMAAIQQGDTGAARRHWEQLRRQLGEDAEASARLDELLARLPASSDAEAAGAGANIRVDVRVEPSLDLALDADTPVFVYARDPKADQGPPLAAARTTVGQLPTVVRLGTAMARASGQTLSEVETLQLVARIAVSGSPQAQPGDYQGSRTVTRTDALEGVTVTIDARR